MSRIGILLFIFTVIAACSSVNEVTVVSDSVRMENDLSGNAKIESIIEPYKDSLSREMDVVIAETTISLAPGRPSSSLGNWMADAIFANQTKTVRLGMPTFCLLNTGGMRSTLNKGSLTVGDIFKLMPFDNEIVWVKLPIEALAEIEFYLKNSGGEPLSNARVVHGKLEINNWREGVTHFWVITSDYLMNGGDKMAFFSKREEVNLTGRLMRDALITEAKEQGTLYVDTISRITF
ncbi:MAG: 5'-nucleotidase C-terminal domain-containing protein [Flavobacteriia bacterium]